MGAVVQGLLGAHTVMVDCLNSSPSSTSGSSFLQKRTLGGNRWWHKCLRPLLPRRET